jgi:hypothetical protein
MPLGHVRVNVNANMLRMLGHVRDGRDEVIG